MAYECGLVMSTDSGSGVGLCFSLRQELISKPEFLPFDEIVHCKLAIHNHLVNHKSLSFDSFTVAASGSSSFRWRLQSRSQIQNPMATPLVHPIQSVFKEPRPVNPNSLPFFNRMVEDLIVNIFGRLEDDPRDLARLACVCRRFHSVIKTSCYKQQCMRVVPSMVSELMQSSSLQDVLVEPPGGWEALQKLLVCCPGLRHVGVLLNCWDYGLEREIGRSDDYELVCRAGLPKLGEESVEDHKKGNINTLDVKKEQEKSGDHMETQSQEDRCGKYINEENDIAGTVIDPKADEHYNCGRSEQRGVDTVCASEAFDEFDASKPTSGKMKKQPMRGDGPIKQMKKVDLHYHGKVMKELKFLGSFRRRVDGEEERGGSRSPRNRERRGSSRERSGNSSGGRSNETERCINHEEELHLAKGNWTLTREQGNKLLASRFRSDSLYICDWPGCSHQGERRVYKLFRGIFKNFQHSHVFRNLKDLRAKKTEIRCAFCSKEMYDMVTSFCLRRSFEYHEDGEPVVRAYVCESGHVAGAWTDRPLYNL